MSFIFNDSDDQLDQLIDCFETTEQITEDNGILVFDDHYLKYDRGMLCGYDLYNLKSGHICTFFDDDLPVIFQVLKQKGFIYKHLENVLKQREIDQSEDLL